MNSSVIFAMFVETSPPQVKAIASKKFRDGLTDASNCRRITSSMYLGTVYHRTVQQV